MSTNGSFIPASVPECPYAPRMTNAQAIALAAGGGLRENCVVVVTDGPVIGNPITGTSATEIELNPVSPSAFGSTARVFTAFDTEAWAGEYDVTTNLLVRLTDNLGNTAVDVDTAAGSPTVQTVFPWGVMTWRDNYCEDWGSFTPVVGLINPVENNRFIGGFTGLDMTGWAPAAFNVIRGCEFFQTGTLHIAGGSAWSRSKLRGGTVNCVGGARINLTDANIDSATITNNATVDATTHRIDVTRSLVSSGSLVQNSDAGGNLTVSESELHGSNLTIAAGAFKSMSITQSTLMGAALNASGGTVLRAFSVSQSDISGGVPINLIGDKPLNISRSRITMGGVQWNIDGQGASGLIINDSVIQACRFDAGPASGRSDINRAVLSSGTIFHNGSGNINVEFTQGSSFLIDQQAGSTGRLDVTGSMFRGGGTITMLPACTRESQFLSCQLTQFSTVDLSGTGTPPAGGDRYDQMDLVSGHFVMSAAAGNLITIAARVRLLGGSEAGSGTLTISGATVGARIDQCEIEGTVTINNELGLTNPISFSGNKVGQGSAILVQGGDASVRQIQNSVINGRSTLTCTNLTGTAGAGLGDVFSCNIDGQSALTVTGARVAGQPVRNLEILNGSAMNVASGGTALQCSARNGATLNTGAFRISEISVEGAFVKTATAAQQNKLVNKAYDDFV
jgi:hypothetical protein